MSAREIPSSPGRHVEELAAFAAAKGASHPSDFVARTLPSGMTYYDYVGQPIEIQEIDKRPYRLIKLINNIEVFLVQDSDYDLATAAMLVKAGYAQDPLNLPGLAHFCEHMLFINTEKYPEAGGFDSFLSIHNGISNAYTDIDHTCYYFSIANAGLEDALDRWSQFFIKPLFDPEYVRREVNAIDSEFKTHINNNAWRLDSLLSSLANPAHPFSKFGTGNYRTLAERAESLGLCLSTEVVSFYDRYYSSDVMSLAIIGSQDIQQLTEWAVQMFSHIPSKGISTKSCSTAPFAQDALGTLVHFKTVGKKFQLSIVFPLPKINHLWKSKPLEVIKDLLEFRAGGTLFDFLKQRGWAYDISCHQESDTDDYSFLRLEVNLTEDGYRSYHDVVRSVFSYLETLRQHHIPETFFNDLRQRRINEFRFEHLDHGTDLSEFLATSFLYSFYPRHLLLSGLNMIYEYSPTDYHLVLDSLRPSNCFFMLGSQDPGVECPLREEHFGVEYCLDVIDSAFVVELEQITPYREFAIPADNRFVSYDLELVSGIERPEEPLLEPTLLLRGKHGEVWHRRDDRFFLPKGKLGIELKMPRAVRTAPDSELVISTYCTLLSEDLERLIDYARVADITTTIKGHHDSIKLVIQGYTPKMLDLLTLILNHIKEFVPSELHFATVKEKQLRELANYVHKESDDYTYKWISYVHTTDGITVDEAVAILEKLDLERLRGLVQRILQSFYTKILVVGNFEEVFALRVHEAVTETFKPQPIVPADINPNRFLLQRKDRHIIHRRSPNESSPLSAVNHTIYCSSRINIEDYAYLLLLTTLADEKLYTMLRTNEAMGYVVYCTVLTATSERTGISFVVKSECNPAYIQLRIDEFFRRFREDVLTNLSDDEFESAVEAEIESCERPDTDIYEEFDTYARWIRAGVHLFDYRKQRVDVLHEATREKLVSFWDERLAPLQPERAPSLTAHVYSAMIRMPTLAERRVYPGTVIALVGCLERDSIRGLDYGVVNDVVAGLRGEKCAAMDYIVRQFKDHLLSRYPSINKDSLDKAFKSEESYSSVALAAAIGSEFVKKQDPRGSRSSGESDIVFETPDGHYILEDHVAYRGLLVEAEPLSLASKYTAKYPEAAATDLDEDELGC